MGVEIGTLVLKGQFGPARDRAPEDPRLRAREMERLRRELLREMREMLDEAERRARER